VENSTPEDESYERYVTIVTEYRSTVVNPPTAIPPNSLICQKYTERIQSNCKTNHQSANLPTAICQNTIDTILIDSVLVNPPNHVQLTTSSGATDLLSTEYTWKSALMSIMCNKNTTVEEMDKVMDVQKLLKERALKNFSESMCTGTNTMDTMQNSCFL